MIDYDPFSDEALADPYPIYRALRDESPVHFLEKYDCWALSRFEDIWRVSSDELRFSLWRDVDLGSIVRVELQVQGPAAVLGGSVAGSLSPNATVAFVVTVELTDVNDPGITVDRPSVPES